MANILLTQNWIEVQTNRPAQEVLARNIRGLMDLRHWKERELANKSGVSQKTINNILHCRAATTMKNMDAIAGAFGLQGWQLLLPEIPVDIIANHSLAEIIDFYARSSTEGRKNIHRIAENEARYGTN